MAYQIADPRVSQHPRIGAVRFARPERTGGGRAGSAGHVARAAPCVTSAAPGALTRATFRGQAMCIPPRHLTPKTCTRFARQCLLAVLVGAIAAHAHAAEAAPSPARTSQAARPATSGATTGEASAAREDDELARLRQGAARGGRAREFPFRRWDRH